jgi:hypothetical protein
MGRDVSLIVKDSGNAGALIQGFDDLLFSKLDSFINRAKNE